MNRLAIVTSLVAGFCLLAGIQLVGSGDVTTVAPAILLFAASLAATAVALGGRPYGPETEGPLDLSTRLAMGLLGGVLAGLVHGLLTVIAAPAAGALASGMDNSLGAEAWRTRVFLGGLWGMGLGIFYFGIPGSDFVKRGLAFSLLPTMVTLLYVYPAVLGAGLFGVRLGSFVWAFVAVGNAIVAVLATAVIAWAGRTDLAPISRPLVE